MNKNTVYILQKDLPNAKAGDKYESTDSGENYINLNAMATWDVSYPKEYIENNSDWFVKEEVNENIDQKITIDDFEGEKVIDIDYLFDGLSGKETGYLLKKFFPENIMVVSRAEMAYMDCGF